MTLSHVTGWCRPLLAGVLVLMLSACASSVSRVETWQGNPAAASEAAVLKAPGEIQVKNVNGRSMTNFLIDDLDLDYALLPGENQVVFTYKTIWANPGVVENGESKVFTVESDPQVVRFDARPNAVYHFEFDKPATRPEAEAMMPTFSATLVDAQGQVVATSNRWTPTAGTAARTPLPALGETASESADGSTLERLKAVWATASDEEKRAFLRWAFE
ncbi:DUF2057 family protein [Marinobacter lutaoensis]|jgi:uncharacterized protein YccT (UPF0319 family)|uniref:DUF2057 domain-containing protein n=1 Tax=Marinobacter lutaoensis TaxID=135739 RepID=A0A1V2DVJ4_9GAMM|nr:DUF2057 family protein [Marinobacter lutaoensis]MBE02615.1 DUF2057 domain-containing protein [Marinobacter sp.]MBI44036.1 DUF2057 domain-containing protein [Oceanospirillales bacterium]NVD35603.1 DUF2057 family protein [Marinobacter lutaoensis]ONF44712.1 DUF2057 domain-containing protein [Marinobacter lutaoensis]|tara:strand:- start:6542 stop:7192 length:651 start_codon:yes stop_codon:yes gene_type:complete